MSLVSEWHARALGYDKVRLDVLRPVAPRGFVIINPLAAWYRRVPFSLRDQAKMVLPRR